MSYLALYRKYRPTTFDKLIGQEHVVKTLVNQIESGKFGHAYLFTGSRGTGKTSAAKIFSKALNCLHPVHGSPCGKCETCLALSDSSNIDVIEIDAASNNGVNEIRDLREKVQYPPTSCKYKVYIIDEVHMLTGPAFNALLKTLEEPPKHAVFILATTEVHKIPATILSRCMRFDFRLIPTEKIAQLISEIYDEQGKVYEKEAVYAIAKAGEGSIRDALSVADIAISYNEGKLTYEDVMQIIGSSNFENLISFISNIMQEKTGEVLSIIDKLCSLGKSMGVLTKDITAFLRDLIVVKTCENANNILGYPDNKFSALQNLCEICSEQKLLRTLEIFAEQETALRYSNNPRVLFETSAIKACRPDSDYDFDAMLARIKQLENKLEDISKNGVVVNSALADKTVEEKNIQSKDYSADNEKKVIEETVKPEINEKKFISNFSNEDLKGKLLFALRKNGSEMLWNVMQSVDVKINGNILELYTKNTSDLELLDMSNNRAKIEQALDEFLPFEIQIDMSNEEKTLDEVDKAIDDVKKIFGDDIVIVKH